MNAPDSKNTQNHPSFSCGLHYVRAFTGWLTVNNANGLNSNVSETLAIFERALEQHDTILGSKYLNIVLKIKLFFISLTETPGE